MPSHVAVRDDNGFAVATRGRPGREPIPGATSEAEADAYVVKKHGVPPPTPEQREAALFGSAWGWDTDGADPATWTAKGR